MLINLCENYCNTKVRCDKPSTDGYEVNNLLISNSPGFLAYSTIKPPINIDFDFTCNIRLSHIIVWPWVGSQKSTGFKLSTIFHRQQSHNLLSSGFLDENHTGILFSTKYVDDNSISISGNFLKVTINSQHNRTINSINNLRVTIVKTNKTVPALNRIEIWGFLRLSYNPFGDGNKILNSFLKRDISPLQTTTPSKSCDGRDIIAKSSIESSESLTIPEEYLDPITWTLMLQPIVLPSGNIIDRRTLENYGENEALWGRPLSDPFTGIALNDNHKPIFASQLKLRIDKFLSNNSEKSEIKQLPRVLGHGNTFNEPSFYSLEHRNVSGSKSNQEKLVLSSRNVSTNRMNDRNKSTIHKLPIFARQCSGTISRKNVNKIPSKMSTTMKTTVLKLGNDTIGINCEIDENLKNNLQNVLSNLKRFNDLQAEDKNTIMERHMCDCCEFPIFYKLPCNHIVCRKIIISQNGNSNNNDNKNDNDNRNLHCPRCNLHYKSSEIIKFHN